MVAVVRRQLGIRAVGHAGTLDPFATGLLVVLTGRATRLARFIESARKEYHAVIEFGRATDTEDSTGSVTAERIPEVWPDRDRLDAALAALTGVIHQRPPAYSAKHVAGVRSYALARMGQAVELPEVAVMVHRLEVTGWDAPRLTIDAEVGKGTYLRSLARDLGEAVGLPAHCAALRRTAIGPFAVADAIAPTEVTPESVRPAAAMVAHLHQQSVDAASTRELGFGRRVPRVSDGDGPAALVAADDGRLIAVAEATEDGWWQPVVVLEPAA